MSDDPTDRPDEQPTRSLPPAVDLSADIPAFIGHYRILGKLGEGGMGLVYLAEQESPRRQVAIKVVRGGSFVDEAMVRMFRREADTLARLKHPNIAAIYESGRTEDGHHFFAMELVQGQTLDVFLSSRGAGTNRNEAHFRLALFRKLADTVHYAHQRGVIHRGGQGLSMAGLLWKPRKSFNLGGINHFVSDTLNVLYLEAE
jgi:serine/threonine protein kinase